MFGLFFRLLLEIFHAFDYDNEEYGMIFTYLFHDFNESIHNSVVDLH